MFSQNQPYSVMEGSSKRSDLGGHKAYFRYGPCNTKKLKLVHSNA